MDYLLDLSDEFDEHITSIFSEQPYDLLPKTLLTRMMCQISCEHATSLRILIVNEKYTSSQALLRLQYESLVKAFWIYFCAAGAQISVLFSNLDKESEQQASKFPMLSRMLDDLDGKAPEQVVEQFLEFKAYTWKYLNSIVHGGIHAIDRHSKGYPTVQIVNSIKCSNSLNAINGYFVARLTGQLNLAREFNESLDYFKDCLTENNSS